LWDPLSLAFCDAHLEERYTQYLADSTFLAVDWAFAYYGMASNLVVALLESYRGRQFGFLVTSSVNFCCGASVAIALRRENRQWFLKNRTQMILVLRSVRMTSGICAYHLFPWDAPGRTLLVRSIVFGLFCTYWTCGMPLNFKVHAMHHSIALALIFLLLQNPFCGQQRSDPWFRAFEFLNYNGHSDDQPDEQCRRALLFVLFVFGYALPMMILWAMELRSRMHFREINRLPVEGGIGKRYMVTLLFWSLISMWILASFG